MSKSVQSKNSFIMNIHKPGVSHLFWGDFHNATFITSKFAWHQKPISRNLSLSCQSSFKQVCWTPDWGGFNVLFQLQHRPNEYLLCVIPAGIITPYFVCFLAGCFSGLRQPGTAPCTIPHCWIVSHHMERKSTWHCLPIWRLVSNPDSNNEQLTLRALWETIGCFVLFVLFFCGGVRLFVFTEFFCQDLDQFTEKK